MMTDDPDEVCAPGWRLSHAPRDPIGARLKAISMLNRQIGRRIGESMGVNVTDMAALEHLLNNGPMTPGQLAEHLKVTTAASTQIVDRLEKAGHVARRRQVGDRRKICVVPVEASLGQAFERLSPMIDGLNAVIARLDPSERQVIESFLDQVLEIYRSAVDPPPPTPDPH